MGREIEPPAKSPLGHPPATSGQAVLSPWNASPTGARTLLILFTIQSLEAGTVFPT